MSEGLGGVEEVQLYGEEDPQLALGPHISGLCVGPGKGCLRGGSQQPRHPHPEQGERGRAGSWALLLKRK